MKECKSLWEAAKGQLHHHFFTLFIWMLIGSIAHTIIMGCVQLIMPASGVLYQGISLLLSFVNVVFVNTIMFLFIKRVRAEDFQVRDILFSVKMFVYHILMGLVLSFLQTLLQEVCYLLGAIMIVYYIVAFFLQGFFFYWNAIIAYAIYDDNHVMKEYVSGAFRMLLVNWKTVMIMSIPYIVVCFIVQIAASSIYLQSFDSLVNFNNIILSLSSAKANSLTLGAMYVVYYSLQIAVLVVLLQMIANLYDRYASIYLPSGKRVHK